MRHSILLNTRTLTSEAFPTFAVDLKLDANAFKTCILDVKKYETEIQRDVGDAGGVGITGTPSFVIGRTSAEGLDGTRLVGAQPYAIFDAKLKALLAAK